MINNQAKRCYLTLQESEYLLTKDLCKDRKDVFDVRDGGEDATWILREWDAISPWT